MVDPDFFFYGDIDDDVMKEFLWQPDLKPAAFHLSGKRFHQLPWEKLGQYMCPQSTKTEGAGKLYFQEGWSGFCFWDKSQDSGETGNSGFFARGAHNFEVMKTLFQEQFPAIHKRIKVPLVKVED